MLKPADLIPELKPSDHLAGIATPPLDLLKRLLRYGAVPTLLFLAALPLLWPTIPPLMDVPNHLSRYRIMLDYDRSALFRSWFEIHHVIVGNLGTELLVGVLAPIVGLEPAAKLVILAIPVLSTAGILWISREVHGRVSPFVPFAAILVYNYPFNFGFLNFTLAMALTLLAFGLWLHLGRTGRLRTRAVLFLPLGVLIWLTHASGWGLLGLAIMAWETASERATGVSLFRAARTALFRCLPLAAPLVPLLLWSSHTPLLASAAYPMFAAHKIGLFVMMLSDGHLVWDVAAALILIGVALLPMTRPELGWDRRLGTVGLVWLGTYIAMPDDVLGSRYADMRIAPYALMIVLISLSPRAWTRWSRLLAIFSWLFLTEQTIAHTLNNRRIAAAQEYQLHALDRLPSGSTVFALADVQCPGDLSGDRMNHLHRMAIVRRGAVTNGSWGFPATQVVLPRPWPDTDYVDEGSSQMMPSRCLDRVTNAIDPALAVLPRSRFRYLWVIDMPRERWPRRPWLHLMWSEERGALYSIDPPAASATPVQAATSRSFRSARPDARAIATQEN